MWMSLTCAMRSGMARATTRLPDDTGSAVKEAGVEDKVAQPRQGAARRAEPRGARRAGAARVVGDSANLFWPAGSRVFKRGDEPRASTSWSRVACVCSPRTAPSRAARAGNFFGELSLLLGTPHEHAVEAVEDSELMVVPKELFDELVGSNTELVARLKAEAEQRLRENLALAAERA